MSQSQNEQWFLFLDIASSCEYLKIMEILYLIRQGQVSFGQNKYDRLSPVGIHQAQILGEYLAGIHISFSQANA